ncbi:hypothetical protein HALLA_12835 [Halostagnicola larsenii XH-48]|uniref:Pyrrolo-quinoline quinone n=1 Tax=Halostagnicola larsenii XH-48 TaxID=797299 RepID=W0JUR4_9EURY|nr:hypothetical protein HALLA_12835 [Halostagnicola larsenii XH-48]
MLYALEPADGSTRWTVETVDVRAEDPHYESEELVPSPFRPETVAVANGTVYAALEGATFIDERDGEQYESTFTCGFGAVDAETGDREWGVAFTPDHAGGDTTAPITANEAFVNVNLTGGDGNFRLSTAAGSGDYRERSVRAGTETTFVQNHWDMDGLLTVRDHENGNHWSVRSGVHAWMAPIVIGNTLITDHFDTVPDHVEADYPERSFVAFDIADGSERWVLDFDEEFPNSEYGRPIAADKTTLYIPSAEGLVALRASDSGPREDESDNEDDEENTEDNNENDDEGELDNEDGGEDGKDDDDRSDCECEAKDGDSEDAGSDGLSADEKDAGNESNREDRDDGSGDGSNAVDDESNSNNVSSEVSEDDEMPGFTGGAGLLGGAATLEWLRRKAGTDNSIGVDESAE